MTHSDAGRYAAKHKPDRSPDERIAAADPPAQALFYERLIGELLA